MFKIKDEFKFNIFTIKWNRIFVDEAHEVLNTHIKLITIPHCDNLDLHYIIVMIFLDFIVKRDEISFKLMKMTELNSHFYVIVENFKWCITAILLKIN